MGKAQWWMGLDLPRTRYPTDRCTRVLLGSSKLGEVPLYIISSVYRVREFSGLAQLSGITLVESRPGFISTLLQAALFPRTVQVEPGHVRN